MRLRLTGPVALNDEQFATLQQGAVESTVLSFVLVCAILLGAVRSAEAGRGDFRDARGRAGADRRVRRARDRLAEPDLGRVRGAVHRAGGRFRHPVQRPLPRRAAPPRRFARGAARRRRDESDRRSCWPAPRPRSAFWRSSRPAIPGFASSDGSPASACLSPSCSISCCCRPLLTLLRPRGEPEPVGFRRAAPLDRLLLRAPPLGHRRRRRAGRGLARAAAAGQVRFRPAEPEGPESRIGHDGARPDEGPDDDALHGRDPRAVAAPGRGARRPPGELPEVAQAITAASFVPTEQEQKLAILGDLRAAARADPDAGRDAAAAERRRDRRLDGRAARGAAAGRRPRWRVGRRSTAPAARLSRGPRGRRVARAGDHPGAGEGFAERPRTAPRRAARHH